MMQVAENSKIPFNKEFTDSGNCCGAKMCEPRHFRDALESVIVRAKSDRAKLSAFRNELPLILSQDAQAALKTIGHGVTVDSVVDDIIALESLERDLEALRTALPCKLNPQANRALAHLIDSYQYKLRRR